MFLIKILDFFKFAFPGGTNVSSPTGVAACLQLPRYWASFTELFFVADPGDAIGQLHPSPIPDLYYWSIPFPTRCYSGSALDYLDKLYFLTHSFAPPLFWICTGVFHHHHHHHDHHHHHHHHHQFNICWIWISIFWINFISSALNFHCLKTSFRQVYTLCSALLMLIMHYFISIAKKANTIFTNLHFTRQIDSPSKTVE